MSVVRSSSWSQSVRLKIAKNRRSESEFLTTDVTDITDARGSEHNQRGQPLTFVVCLRRPFKISETRHPKNRKVDRGHLKKTSLNRLFGYYRR